MGLKSLRRRNQVVIFFLKVILKLATNILLLSVKIYNNQSIFSLDSAFKQQRLPAWQPILTAGTVLPTFFVIGVAFIPIGIGMMYFSSNVSKQP